MRPQCYEFISEAVQIFIVHLGEMEKIIFHLENWKKIIAPLWKMKKIIVLKANASVEQWMGIQKR